MHEKTKKASLWSLVLVLLYFGINSTIEYALDTYPTFQMTGTWVEKIEKNGRLLLGAIYYVIEHMHLSNAAVYYMSYAAAMFFLLCAVVILSLIIDERVDKIELSVGIAFVTLVNPFCIEYFLFIEKGLFMLTFLLNTIALLVTCKIWKGGATKVKMISQAALVLCLLFCSVFIYQTSIQIYVILSLPIIAFYADTILDFVKKNIFVATMYVLPMGTAYLVAKFMFPVERLESADGLSSAVSKGFDTIRIVFFEQFHHLKKGMLLFYIVVLLAVCILEIINEREGKLKSVILTLYIVLGTFFTSFLLFFLDASADAAPRSVYTGGMIYGVCLFYVFGKNGKKDSKIAFKILGAALMVFIIFTDYVAFQKIFIERYKCNQEDKYLCEIIGEKIKEYEEESGEKIDTICYYKDKSVTWWDSGYGKSQLVIRAQSTGWSRIYSLNMYLESNYKEGEPNKDIEKFFSDRNWDTYSDEQIKFEKNIAHICVY